ncbi:MAG: hypothetical protein HY758_10180 [Nitrospirae bacterium]|nr:hypothetical protein [Nitrospirota bacterium]
MNSSLQSYLSKVTFGEMQKFENMGVLPIFSPLNECLEYFTLSEALMNQLITVTEHDSGVVLSSKIRSRKTASVSNSLKMNELYASDQHAIWDGIFCMAETEDVRSQTGAMKDVFEKRKHDLDEFLKALTHNPHQQGLLVFINGKVAGLDIIPNEKAYKILHSKLVKSYAMDAILLRKKTGNGNQLDNAASFLDEVRTCREEKHKSVGYGWDYRFQGERVVGSNLDHQLEVIHASFFRVDESDQTGRISNFSRRRDYRV